MTGKQKYLKVKYLCLFFLLKADDKILDQHLIPYRHNTTGPAATSAGAFDRSQISTVNSPLHLPPCRGTKIFFNV